MKTILAGLSEVEHLFLCLKTVYVCISVSCLSCPLPIFLNWVFGLDLNPIYQKDYMQLSELQMFFTSLNSSFTFTHSAFVDFAI